MILKNNKNKIGQALHKQSGNAIVFLFAAIAMAGTVTYGLNNVMRGPGVTATEISRKSIAENNLIATSRLAVVASTAQQGSNADCDGDGFVEPLPYRDAGALPHPVGGGLVPMTMGASISDPWGTQYGYCVWDHGTVSVSSAVAACGGATPGRLQGAPTDDQYALSIISAGKDGTFQTSCNAYVDTTPADGKPDVALVNTPSGSDDVVLSYTYAEANGIGGGVWKLKDGDSGTAVTDKNVEASGGATFTNGPLTLQNKGLVLPGDPGDDTVTGPCDEAKDQQMRRNIGDGSTTPAVEICDYANGNGWVSLTAGVTYDGSIPDQEIQKLVASDATANMQLGFRLAMHGDTLVLGTLHPPNGAYVFTRSGGVWTETQKLVGNDSVAGDYFGQHVGISGDMLAIGSARHDDTFADSGSVYIYKNISGTWTQIQKLSASDAATDDRFGSAIHMSGGTLMVQSLRDDDVAPDAGSVYVFNKSGDVWTQTQKLVPPDIASNDSFGYNIKIEGDTAFISAYLQDGAGADSGAVYVYKKIAGTWTQIQKLTGSDTAAGDQFGTRIDSYGSTLVIGASYNLGKGAAYIFKNNNGTWSEVQKIVPTDSVNGDLFGAGIKINRGLLYIGSAGNDGSLSNTGAVYIYSIQNGVWSQVKKLIASSSVADDTFGRDIVADDTMAIIASYKTDTEAGIDSGAAYVFSASTAETDITLQDEVRPDAADALDSGLIAHWKLDEGTGTGVLDSVGDNHGTFVNTPVWIEGVNGTSALSFNKNDEDAIQIPGQVGTPANLSIGLWANINNYDSSGTHLITLGGAYGIINNTSSSNELSVFFLDGSTVRRVGSGMKIAGTGWHYIVTTFDDVNDLQRIYVDGVLKGEGTETANINWTGATDIYLGRYQLTNVYDLNGALDDVRIYNRALGPAEVAELSKRAMNESLVRQAPAFKPRTGDLNEKLAVGLNHACMIKKDGSAWCWGQGASGGLGNNNTADQASPVRVVDPGPWVSITAGDRFTCGIKADRTAWCWGEGDNYRLGNNSITDLYTPSPVSGGGLWASISAGDYHACGIQLDGSAWCWGYNTKGQIGNNDTAHQTVPVQVNGSSTWKMIQATSAHSCGIKMDDTAWCWGSGNNGRLGTGNTSNSLVPVEVSGNKKWSTIGLSINSEITGGLDQSGDAWCWGYGADGRNGSGDVADTNVPVKLKSPGPWVDIFAGASQGCGIKHDGSLWCWGSGAIGQMGNGTTTATNLLPVRVLLPSSISTARGGNTHICALTTDERAWCWGQDNNGQLGNGNTITANQSIPSPVTNSIDASPWSWDDAFSTIILQGNHTLGLNGYWMSDDGTANKYFGFESAGRAVLRQSTNNQILIDTSAAGASAQITFRGGYQQTASTDITANRITIWNFDDTSGTTAVSAPVFPNAIEGSGFAWSPTGGWDDGAGAIDFGRSDPSRINVTNHASLRPATITISTFVKPSGSQPAGTYILSKTHTDNTGSVRQSYGLQYTDTNRISFVTGRTGAFDTLGSAYVEPDRWTHIAAVFNPAGTAPQKRLYINGALVASETNTNAIVYDTGATGNLFIGAGGCTSMPCGNFGGAIDNLALYSSGLTDAEVYQVYKAYQALIRKPPVIGLNHASNALEISRNTASTNSVAISALTPPAFSLQSSGSLAIGQTTTPALVSVNGGVRMGYQAACSAANAGTIRNDFGSHYECSGNHNNFIARAVTQNWWSIASSTDGMKLAAVAATSGQIYTSTDSGVTWTARESLRDWRGIASSADGVKLVAVAQNGQIYTSTDSGVTWTPRDSSRVWTDVASSADGTKLVAVGQNERIYTSTDSGVTWTPRDSSRAWGDVASSADGTKLVAVVIGGQIYTSTDSGVTWIARDSNRNWVNITSSADGTKLATVVQGGQIYTSTDSGVTWIARNSVRVWRGIASSADGTKLVASVYGGFLFTSTDSGVTWTARESSRNWRGIASSADGTKLATVVANGQIYTSNTCASKSGWATPRQTAMLVPTDPQASSNYSSDNTKSMSTLGKDVAIVGATQADSRGAAYVFDYNAGVWAQAQKIVSNDIAASDGFGVVSNIESDTVMIGATGQDTPTSNSGAVYVFTKSGGTWTQTQKLMPSDPSANKVFGFWIRISGNTAAIGAPGDNGNIGAIYIFEKSGGIWTEKAKLLPTGGSSGEYFSYKFGLSGDLLAAGAVGYNTNTGRTYIYERSGGVWSQTQIIQGTDTAAGDRFGNIADIAGSDILISAWGHNTTAGATYVFQKIGGTWTQTQKLVASDQSSSKEFGVGLAVQNDTAIITADRDDIVATDTGSAYIFKRIGGTWTQVDKFSVLSAVASDEMGRAFFIYDDRVLFGSHRVDTSSGVDYGAAYIFEGAGANPNPAKPFKYCNGTEWKDLPIVTGTPVKAKRDTESFDAGRNATCYAKPDGTVWCWGTNANGQLGIGTSGGSSSIPVPVKSTLTWRSVTTGHQQACGIKMDGSGWCWGSNTDGRLGDGTDTERATPTLISGGGLWRKIETDYYSCGVKIDGTGWCWGTGSYGRLGNGATSNSYVPVELSGGAKWLDVSPSRAYACGIQINGSGWCWGQDDVGQLGNGAALTSNQSSPSLVTGVGTWKKISPSNGHTCGIKTDGTAWCWGAGDKGQMGNGTTTATNPDPVQVTSALGWIDISAAEHTGAVPSDAEHTCGIKTDGTAWCWGRGNEGQMGNGTTTAINSTPVQISDAGPWINIDSGPTYACAQKADGTLWCWGNHQGTNTTNLTPVQVTY